MAEEESVFSRWSRRKRAVVEETPEPKVTPAPEVEAEPETEEDEMALLDRLGLPVPETLKEGDDFSAFMAKGVPQFLRKRALRVLWRSNPVLANLDGLNDYDEDFNSPELTQKVLATGYQVGKGFARRVVDVLDGDEDSEAGEVRIEAEIDPVDNPEAESNSSTLEVDLAEVAQPEPEDAPPRPRRMRFEA